MLTVLPDSAVTTLNPRTLIKLFVFAFAFAFLHLKKLQKFRPTLEGANF